MKTVRKGTNQKIAAKLKLHAELMKQFEAKGMTPTEASQAAYNALLNKVFKLEPKP